ncbi:hypothetical protein PDIDSM_7991 [Penicillium digitatum]|nr:hypothetical protein PDIDSM_7991 [Penicillium digitatum]
MASGPGVDPQSLMQKIKESERLYPLEAISEDDDGNWEALVKQGANENGVEKLHYFFQGADEDLNSPTALLKSLIYLCFRGAHL